MNRKLKFYRKNLFFIRNNIYILFNKKIIKNIFLLNRKNFFFFKRYIKIVILFYLSCLSHYFDYFLPCYNLMRNVFFLFCKIYNITLEKIKYNIIFLFNIIFKKNLIKNLLKIGKLKKKKKISIFFNLNLSIFFNKDTRKNIDKNIR
jgi:hypothetical protein